MITINSKISLTMLRRLWAACHGDMGNLIPCLLAKAVDAYGAEFVIRELRSQIKQIQEVTKADGKKSA